MTTAETPILPSNNIAGEEKIKLYSTKKLLCKIIPFVFIAIWVFGCIPPIIVFSNTDIYASIGPGIMMIIGIIVLIAICNIPDGTNVIINNSNRTLKLQKTNWCCGKTPKIIDLNKIEKIKIFNPTLGNIESLGSYMIIYKDGTSEDISMYLEGCNADYIINFQNFLKKYLPVENAVSQSMGIYTQAIPVYNPNVVPVYNPNVVPVYNPNPNMIPNQANVYYAPPQGVQQNYYQQGYNASGNIYGNNNIYVNQNNNNNNNPIQQNLVTDDGINKPMPANNNYGAPNVPQ